MEPKKQKPATVSSHVYEPTNDENIMRFVDRDGDWTHYWIKSHSIFVPAVNHIIRIGYPKGDRFYNYLLRTTPQEAERKLRTAGEEGARTHDAIRDLINGETIDLDRQYFNELTGKYESLSADEWANVEAFVAWCAVYKPRVLFREYTIWSASYNYAGTLDFVGTITIPENDPWFSRDVRGKTLLILLDWKTSSGVWDEYELQVAAYRTALLEYAASELPRNEFPEIWTGIVRLGTNHKNGYEMKIWNEGESEANFELFLSALEIYKKKSENSSFEPVQKNVPAQFSVNIPPMRPFEKK